MQQSKLKQVMKEAIKSSWIYRFVVWLNDKIFKPVISFENKFLNNKIK